jgi:Ring finger domain
MAKGRKILSPSHRIPFQYRMMMSPTLFASEIAHFLLSRESTMARGGSNRRRDGPEASLVLEGLLAVAKDRRYHKQCQRIVQDVISDPSLEDDDEDETSDYGHYHDESHSSLSSSSTLSLSSTSSSSISSLVASLWMAMVVWRKNGKRTLGMEACGLEFADPMMVTSDGDARTRRWTAAAASILASAASQLYLSQGVPPSRRISEDGVDAGRSSARRRRGHGHHQDHQHRGEALRGAERRQYFEDQRRAMVERSSGTAKRRDDPTSRRSNNVRNDAHRPKPPEARSLASTLLQWARHLAASIASATDDYGPHAVWNESAASSTMSHPQRVQALSIGAWIVRLHLAFYCLGGGECRHSYPSWLHRLFRLSFVPSRDALAHRPNGTPTLAGMLIVAQAIGAGVPAITRAMLRYLERKGLLGSASPPPSAGAKSSIKFVSRRDELPRKRVEPHVSVSEASHGRPRTNAPASSASASFANATAERTCMICRQVRRDPACPPCGHVFCWSCLQQWLEHRPSCPYCRTSCRPQNVMALRKY